uniref:DUF3883 domain-containing protein n=1 Tax=Pseudomonas sp. RW407 TaxID=2202894 RepID=UPI0021145CE3|nr:DUF3883 domain-containing protein [Pseudomonas sp. RW407]
MDHRFRAATTDGSGPSRAISNLEWVADSQGDGAGYDILSFERDGQSRFIEVKTTNSGIASPFLVSHNELEFSKEAGNQFYLYRVFRFRNEPRLFTLRGDLSQHVYLKPTDYRASFLQALGS